jgi:hypothetical protein
MHKRNNQHEKGKKQHTYRLPFVPLSLAFEGGLFHPPGAVNLLMVVVEMVEVDVDGFQSVKNEVWLGGMGFHGPEWDDVEVIAQIWASQKMCHLLQPSNRS